MYVKNLFFSRLQKYLTLANPESLLQQQFRAVTTRWRSTLRNRTQPVAGGDPAEPRGTERGQRGTHGPDPAEPRGTARDMRPPPHGAVLPECGTDSELEFCPCDICLTNSLH